MKVTFIETSIFSKARAQHLSDEELRLFELHLLDNPEVGDLIVGSGGCRKVRWKKQGSGKSGGVRIIYYYKTANARVFLLLLYPKNQQDNLSAQQKQALRKLIEQLE